MKRERSISSHQVSEIKRIKSKKQAVTDMTAHNATAPVMQVRDRELEGAEMRTRVEWVSRKSRWVYFHVVEARVDVRSKSRGEMRATKIRKRP
jgi:hypothetical protein